MTQTIPDNRPPFQPMPDLAPEERQALADDIAARGIVVPVVVDQHSRVIDGHNRQAIATELGIECPTEVRQVADDDEAAELALTLNLARRHLTRAQVREIIVTELHRKPGDSNRAIARRVGCDHKTVATVRAGEFPQQAEPITEAEARENTEQIREHLNAIHKETGSVIAMMLAVGIPAAEVVSAIESGQSATHERCQREQPSVADGMIQFVDRVLFHPLIEFTTGPETVGFPGRCGGPEEVSTRNYKRQWLRSLSHMLTMPEAPGPTDRAERNLHAAAALMDAEEYRGTGARAQAGDQ